MNKFYYYYNPVCTGANTPTAFDSDPYVTVIKEMFVSELKYLVYYIEKLKELNVDMTVYTDKVIEFIGILIVNLDFKKESFFVIFEDLYNNKIMLKKMYISACEKENINPALLSDETSHETSKDLILKFLNNDDKNYKLKKQTNKYSQNQKYLFEIINSLVMTACNNLIELKSYKINYEEAKNKVLDLFNNANKADLSENDIKEKINNFAQTNFEIIKKFYNSIETKYGKVSAGDVSFSKKEGKAILVSGNNLNDLENLLRALNGLNINVYTHNGMIRAFLYESFRNNPNMAGHYQYSDNNYSIDFAAFPGPIFICGNQTPKIDLIRGQIYTTAKYPAYGIAKIENNDYSGLIEYALDSKGFEKNIKEKSVSIGYDSGTINCLLKEIIEKKKQSQINRIIIIGMSETYNQKKENITGKFNEDDFIISFIIEENRDNFKYINSLYDYPLLYEIIETLKENLSNIENDIIVCFNECTKITISQLFNLMYLGIKNIYLGQYCPSIINPVIISGLEEIYNIKQLKDLN